MLERRTKRSESRDEALQYLVEAVADRSDVEAVVLVDDAGRIVAGTGMPIEVRDLARIARPVARGDRDVLSRVAEGSDVLARSVDIGDATLYLAALGTHVRKMTDAARAIARIARADSDARIARAQSGARIARADSGERIARADSA